METTLCPIIVIVKLGNVPIIVIKSRPVSLGYFLQAVSCEHVFNPITALAQNEKQ